MPSRAGNRGLSWEADRNRKPHDARQHRKRKPCPWRRTGTGSRVQGGRLLKRARRRQAPRFSVRTQDEEGDAAITSYFPGSSGMFFTSKNDEGPVNTETETRRRRMTRGRTNPHATQKHSPVATFTLAEERKPVPRWH